jgi:hypothetical protein
MSPASIEALLTAVFSTPAARATASVMIPASATLPELAADEPREEALFIGGRAREQMVELLAARCDGSRACRRRRSGEHSVDLRHLEAGDVRGRGERSERRPAHAGPPLPKLAGEIADDHGDLVRGRPAKARGDRFDLGQSRPRRCHGGRCRDEVGKQHAFSVTYSRPRPRQ